MHISSYCKNFSFLNYFSAKVKEVISVSHADQLVSIISHNKINFSSLGVHTVYILFTMTVFSTQKSVLITSIIFHYQQPSLLVHHKKAKNFCGFQHDSLSENVSNDNSQVYKCAFEISVGHHKTSTMSNAGYKML